jgi:hypothetical protein
MSPASAQLNENCTVSILNRTVQVNPDGSYVVPNVPANSGPTRVRATCVSNGVSTFGQSELITVGANGVVNSVAIQFGTITPIPTGLTVSALQPMLTTAEATVQLSVAATYPDGNQKDVTHGSAGTVYTTSSAATASVSPDGLVTARTSGTALISASNEGALGVIQIQVIIGGSNGGIPIDWAIAHGLDPNSPTMPMEDPDHDGLTNFQEFNARTDPNNPDTDGDGLTDADELNTYKTFPDKADSDGDGIPDGVEVQKGTDPSNAQSYDYATELSGVDVAPATFMMSVNSLTNQATQQLIVTGHVIDGKTNIDLTPNLKGTNYSSSDLNVCNFASPDGLVSAGASGSCIITVTNSGFTATSNGTVSTFSPVEVSNLSIPGAVAADIGGGFLSVATGTGGMVVVDVNDRTKPYTRGALGGLGDAEGVRVWNGYVLIADSTGNLQIAQAANPDTPLLLTTFPIPGNPLTIAAHGNLGAVAAQSGGVTLVDLTNPLSPVLLSTIPGPPSTLSTGVDFDQQTNLLAIALSGGGLQLVDISNLASPSVLSLLPGGDVRRVLLRYPAALLADNSRGVTGVDITNPAQPGPVNPITGGFAGAPVDIAASGNFAVTADHSFGKAVPIVSILDPLQPVLLSFWNYSVGSFSTGIAMDASFAYLILPDPGLRILQYQNIIDNGGIPPQVTITYPVTNEPLIQGSTITFKVDATDDVAVQSVTFLVNGTSIATSYGGPYQTSYTVPTDVSSVTFSATAIDYGNNVGTAMVTVPAIPDPLTTATGRVTDSSSAPLAGASVTSLGQTSTTASDGSFTLPGIPTIRGNIVVTASATVNSILISGSSTPVPPVLGGIVNVGTIIAVPRPVISGLSQREALANTTVSGLVVSGDNLQGATFSAVPSGGITASVVSTSIDGTSATLNLNVAANLSGAYVLVGSNGAGPSDSNPTGGNTITVFNLPPDGDADSDGLNNAQEISLGTDPTNGDTDGDRYIDGLESLFGSNPLDANSIPVISAPGGEVDLTFSVLNKVDPAADQPTPEEPTVTFSVLNKVDPAADQPTPEEPTVTFSVLNKVNPAADQPTPEEPTVTFSVLNKVNPAADQPTPEEPTVTFSILNKVNPAADQPTPEEPTVTFSVLNKVVPGGDQPSVFEPFVIFSVLNNGGSAYTAISSALKPSAYPGFPMGPDTPVTVSFLRQFGPSIVARRILLSNFIGVDSDGDGLPDAIELLLGSGAFTADSDGDGLSDGIEYLLKGDPFSARPEDDDDADGLTNIEEVRFGTDPSRLDTDGDGLSDGEEVQRHTDPLRMDTDGDRFPDGLEVALGTDPLDAQSFPSREQLRAPVIFGVPFSVYNARPGGIARSRSPKPPFAAASSKRGDSYAKIH